MLPTDRSVRSRHHHGPVFIAELICSDDACELTLEVPGGLAELELLVCDGCGCCLQVVSLSAFEAAELQPLRELTRAA